MLDRNKRIKPRPERFQNCKDLFDLILTCEERVYDQVVEGEWGAWGHRQGHPTGVQAWARRPSCPARRPHRPQL